MLQPVQRAPHSPFTKSDDAPKWVRTDPDLAAAWALDRSATSSETDVSRRCRVYSEIAKYEEEWSLSETSDAGKGKAVARSPPVPLALPRRQFAPRSRRQSSYAASGNQPPDKAVAALRWSCAAGGTMAMATVAVRQDMVATHMRLSSGI